MKEVFSQTTRRAYHGAAVAVAVLATPFLCLGQGTIAVFAERGILLSIRGRSAMAVPLRTLSWTVRTQ